MNKHLPNSLRALFLSLAVLLSLPMLAAQVVIGGINYELNAEAKQATVIATNSGEYYGKVVIPESVEYEGAAYSVTSIGSTAFFCCSGLTSVTIPNSVTSIGSYAFDECSGLTSVTIPNSVTSIGESAFRDCSGLTSVTIGNSVTSIGSTAFFCCSGLTSVTIPNSVTSIGGGAFAECSGLTSIVVEDRNPVYDSRNNCNAIIETATNTLHFGCKTTIIPNSVTCIGGAAFYNCSGLASVTIPNSVTSIRTRAFGGCSGLTSIVVEDGNPVYDSRNNCNAIIETATNTLHFGCKTTIIPNSVTSIGGAAFAYCSGLTSVTIPNSVTSIGYGAFYKCSGLTSVTIGNSVTSIGDEAFAYCSALTSVTIGNSVASIGDYAFYECSGLTSVTIGSGVESIGNYAFYSCPDLLDVYCYAEKVPSTESNAFDGSYPENATLHVPDASIDSYKATAPWSSFGKIVGLSGDETGIDELKGENGKVKTVLYDLSGRRVQKGQKGVFIQNGKVMVR